jgi:hypothetical protein
MASSRSREGTQAALFESKTKRGATSVLTRASSSIRHGRSVGSVEHGERAGASWSTTANTGPTLLDARLSRSARRLGLAGTIRFYALFVGTGSRRPRVSSRRSRRGITTLTCLPREPASTGSKGPRVSPRGSRHRVTIAACLPREPASMGSGRPRVSSRRPRHRITVLTCLPREPTST